MNLSELEKILKDVKRDAFLTKQAEQKAKVEVKVEKIPIPKQADYKWSSGPIVALMVNGEFLGMYQEMTCEKILARRLTHLDPQAELDAVPTVVETLPEWKEPTPPQVLIDSTEVIKPPLPSNIELISIIAKRNKRLGLESKPNVEAMLEELGLRSWE